MIAVIDSAIDRRLKSVVRFRAGARQPDPLGPTSVIDRTQGFTVNWTGAPGRMSPIAMAVVVNPVGSATRH